MSYFLAVTARSIDATLFSANGDVALRLITSEEQIAIEDRIFKDLGRNIELPEGTSVLSVDEKLLKSTTPDEFKIAVEFALAVLCESGAQGLWSVAHFGATGCSSISRIDTSEFPIPVYPSSMTGQVICVWLELFLQVRQKFKDRMHVTADRFVRYCKAGVSLDSLLDLCICLESLIGADNEISFRFSVCLAKVEGGDSVIDVCEALKLLYDLRSSLVHGADSAKPFRKLEPKLPLLHSAARTIIAKYLLHLIDNSPEDWKKHLKSNLLS